MEEEGEVAISKLFRLPQVSSILGLEARPQLPCSASTMTFRHYQDSPALAAEADKLVAAIVGRRQGIPA